MPRRILIPIVLALPACFSLPPEVEERLETFDFVWESLRDGYPFFGRKGIDWEEVGGHYRAAVGMCTRPADFCHLLAGMLSELGDNHVSLDIPPAWWRRQGVVPTSLEYVPGFSLVRIRNRMHVASWPAGAVPHPPDHLAPEQATLPELVRVEGHPLTLSLGPVLMLGEPGSRAELLLRWRDGTLSHHALRRPAAVAAEPGTRPGSLPSSRPASVPASGPASQPLIIRIVTEPPASSDWRDGIRYLRIANLHPDKPDVTSAFWATVDGAVDEAIAHDAPMIIDLRSNHGGRFEIMARVLARFLPAEYSLVVRRPDASWLGGLVTIRWLGNAPVLPLEPVFKGPLVVLTDSGTASAAEHLAMALRSACGAVIVGERTAGMSAAVHTVTTPDGIVLKFSRDDLSEGGHPTLQDDGVHPDVVVERSVARYAEIGQQSAALQWEIRLYVMALTLIRERAAATSRPASSRAASSPASAPAAR